MLVEFGFSRMAAALLAVDHFNGRNPAVMPELADLDCNNVQLPEPKCSNFGSVGKTVRYLATVNKGDFCGIVGPYYNNQAFAASNFAHGYDTPSLAMAATPLNSVHRRPILSVVEQRTTFNLSVKLSLAF